MTNQKHYVYGSGMPGCLYDWGPNFTERKEDAIDSLVEFFSHSADWSEDECDTSWQEIEKDMRESLEQDGIYYFPSAVRPFVGASYCQLSPQNGPCPDSEDD